MATFELTTPDGKRYQVDAADADTAQKAFAAALGPSPVDATSPRAARETIAPETPDLRREADVARTMARDRQKEGWADRATLQGLTLGFSDEIRAGLRGLTGSDPATEIEAARRLRREDQVAHPMAAPVVEGVAGAIPAGIASLLTGGAAIPAAGAAALHGLGSGEAIPDRLGRAAAGGVLGAAGGGLGQAGDTLSQMAGAAPGLAKVAAGAAVSAVGAKLGVPHFVLAGGGAALRAWQMMTSGSPRAAQRLASLAARYPAYRQAVDAIMAAAGGGAAGAAAARPDL